jgi:hypothetical protein
VQRGSKRLVIDLRGNGGGTIDFGFEVFRQLFPSVEPYGGSRYRAHEAFQDYSTAIADLAANGTVLDGIVDKESPFEDADFANTPFLWSNILDANQEPYTSFEDYYGPDELQSDAFTSVRRYNVSQRNADGDVLLMTTSSLAHQVDIHQLSISQVMA